MASHSPRSPVVQRKALAKDFRVACTEPRMLRIGSRHCARRREPVRSALQPEDTRYNRRIGPPERDDETTRSRADSGRE